MPSVDEYSQLRLSSPSPPPFDKSKTSTAQINESPRYRKNGLTRSSTETQIFSLQNSKQQSPFSVLLPLTATSSKSGLKSSVSSIASLRENIISEETTVNTKESNDIKNFSGAKRYSKDFLLIRSDVESSKKLPPNWKALNEIFPSICFCGKVKIKLLIIFLISKDKL